MKYQQSCTPQKKMLLKKLARLSVHTFLGTGNNKKKIAPETKTEHKKQGLYLFQRHRILNLNFCLLKAKKGWDLTFKGWPSSSRRGKNLTRHIS